MQFIWSWLKKLFGFKKGSGVRHHRWPTTEQMATLPWFEGYRPDQVVVVETKEGARRAYSALSQAGAVGFDTESKPTFRKGEKSHGPHVAQFATLQQGFVFMLHDPDCRQIVGQLIELASLEKIGFGLNDDVKRLRSKLGIQPQGVLDLETMFRSKGFGRGVGAKVGVAIALKQRFKKSKKISTSNWGARHLTDAQILYAADDAFAAISVYHALTSSPKRFGSLARKIVGVLVCYLLCGSLVMAAGRMPEESAIDHRLSFEEPGYDNPWAILPHRINYILPFTHLSHVNDAPFQQAGTPIEFENIEAKFQLSFKYPLWNRVIAGRGVLFFAYTQLSLWQAYNGSESAPFRNTDHEPELFLTFKTRVPIGGLTGRVVSAGVSHQSNGRSPDTLSRSWNRVWANFILERGNFVIDLKPWWGIPESDSSDDNPGIERYMGYGEMRTAYVLKRHVISLMLRNNLRSEGNRGAMEIGYSFPLTRRVKGFVQYFNGYGESLIDYNFPVNRIGIGFLLADLI
jgi:phospholipase A1/A2